METIISTEGFFIWINNLHFPAASLLRSGINGNASWWNIKGTTLSAASLLRSGINGNSQYQVNYELL